MLVNVSLPANVANVPTVGKVTFVVPVAVNVWEKAPAVENVELLASVRVAAFAGCVSVTLFMAPNTCKFPPNDASLPTTSLLLNETSPTTNNRLFNDTSFEFEIFPPPPTNNTPPA